jgi:hypothetical protein
MKNYNACILANNPIVPFYNKTAVSLVKKTLVKH